MKLQWAGESVYRRVMFSVSKTTHFDAVLHDCNPHDDKNMQNKNMNTVKFKNFLTKISESVLL